MQWASHRVIPVMSNMNASENTDSLRFVIMNQNTEGCFHGFDCVVFMPFKVVI